MGSAYGARTAGAAMIEALGRVPYFAGLPEAQIQQIARHVRTRLTKPVTSSSSRGDPVRDSIS